MGTPVPYSDADYASLMTVSGDLTVEIAKACIFKMLIQIDRSSRLLHTHLTKSILFYLKIEYKSICKILNGNSSQLNRLSCIIRKLNISSSVPL